MTVSSVTAMPVSQRSRGQGFKVLLKTVAVLALLAILARKGLFSISMDATKRALMDARHMLPAAAGLGFTLVLGVIRWHWLLKAQDIHLKFGRTTELTFVGNFFNITLPGAVSGDVVKAYYIGHELPGQRARAFGAILFDRIVGLSALVMVSAGALTWGYSRYRGTPLLVGIQAMMSLAALGVIAFYAYLFLVRENYDPLLISLRKFAERVPRAGSLARIYEGVRHYHHHRGVVLRALLLSIVVQLVVGWACLNFARALDEFAVGLNGIYVVVPLGLLVTAVPVAPAGVGTGHFAFSYLLKLLGSSRGADVFSLYAIVQLFYGALGGLVYLRFRSHGRHAS